MAKKTVIKHFGKVVNGKRIYYNDMLHNEYVSSLEGEEFEEVIKLKSKRVSQDAHGYYRGGILGECMNYEMFRGWSRDEIHLQHFAPMFLSYTKTTKYIAGGETMYRESRDVISTASLNSKEMFEFCELCIQWLAEHGIVVHTPQEYLLGKYKTEERHI
ncbi:MAG: hypothetical protein V4549_07535 [Bacteroidota bacterium]